MCNPRPFVNTTNITFPEETAYRLIEEAHTFSWMLFSDMQSLLKARPRVLGVAVLGLAGILKQELPEQVVWAL